MTCSNRLQVGFEHRVAPARMEPLSKVDKSNSQDLSLSKSVSTTIKHLYILLDSKNFKKEAKEISSSPL